ncbi:hypothetical protein [Salimicrobium flavidum]|uniref:hypothetical protein n=1 Tax=Salimicrobium flavidum TaxID=570947 RepID=UPI0013565043|nr:hypothetical protein [Salimicrobium flavidum]
MKRRTFISMATLKINIQADAYPEAMLHPAGSSATRVPVGVAAFLYIHPIKLES